MEKAEQKTLGKIISHLTDEFRQLRLVDYPFLENLITRFDEYEKLDDPRPEIRSKFNETDIEETHQHILIFLLELDRVRPQTSNSLFLDHPKLL